MADMPGEAEWAALLRLRDATAGLDRARVQAVREVAMWANDGNASDDARAELEALRAELADASAALNAVRANLAALDQAEAVDAVELARLQEAVQQHRHTVYDPAKAHLDGLRAQVNLPRMPSIEDDVDATVARYLDERRQQGWSQPPPSIVFRGPAPPSVSSSSSSGSSSRGGRRVH